MRESNAQDFEGYLRGDLSIAKSRGNLELEVYISELLRVYKKFERIGVVEVDSWKGKSSIEIIKKVDKILVKKYQKPQKGAEPKEVVVEIYKNELNNLIVAINSLSHKKSLKTSELAGEWCKRMGITETDKGVCLWDGWNFIWDTFFSWRRMHNKFTLMLNVLDKEMVIVYRGGVSKVINRKMSIQELLM